MSHAANVRPTKRLFIDALTSDLEVVDAINDLVDNCEDAARASTAQKGALGHFKVEIIFSEDRFEIKDNCGGIPAEVAEKYAFRLGRPDDFKGAKGTIGRFGIGMKRAMFLIGKKINVKSKTINSSFEIILDVDKWIEAGDNSWDIPFTTFEKQSSVQPSEVGTTITIENINDDIKSELGSAIFRNQLIEELQKRHKSALMAGMQIKVGAALLISEPYQIKKSDFIVPAFHSEKLNGRGREPIQLKLIAGIEESKPAEAGWYIACNGRFILVADRSSKTGWGDMGSVMIPKMHHQFARFRGYAFFECDDPARLPWNSTKTGVSSESPIFKKARQLMVAMTRPVIDALNLLDKELDLDVRPLEDALKASPSVPITSLLDGFAEHSFKFEPSLQSDANPDRLIRIAYSKPLRLVKQVRAKLGVEQNRDVGAKTFEYFAKNELK
jgi:hypothetical protein